MPHPKKVVVVGASGHAGVVLDILEQQSGVEVVGCLDNHLRVGTVRSRRRVIGACEDLPALVSAGVVDCGVVAVGDNFTRATLVSRILRLIPGFTFVSAIHPSAIIASSVRIAEGVVVTAGTIVSPGCVIGPFCILNTGSSLDHDSVMADFSSLGPAAITGGGVRIGTGSAVSIGATVLQEISIGDHVVIGANSLVNRDVPSFVVAYGIPARIVRSREPGEPYLVRLPPLDDAPGSSLSVGFGESSTPPVEK